LGTPGVKDMLQYSVMMLTLLSFLVGLKVDLNLIPLNTCVCRKLYLQPSVTMRKKKWFLWGSAHHVLNNSNSNNNNNINIFNFNSLCVRKSVGDLNERENSNNNYCVKKLFQKKKNCIHVFTTKLISKRLN